MKESNTFSDNEPSFTASPHELGRNNDGRTLSSPFHVSQDTLPSSASPLMKRWSTVHHQTRLLPVVVTVLVVLGGGYGVFRIVSPPSRQTPSAFQQTDCPFLLGGGFVAGKNAKCGFLTVPEDWSQPNGPTIRLAVAILKTSDPHPSADPVLVLGGGPGVATLETLGPTMYNLGSIPSNRDLILFDQRGEGYSQPSLYCPDNETLQACHTRLVKSGINLNDFTTLENAADVHALIRTLGYQHVNLDGLSYGTRLALTVMRFYPADVRSVVLDSVLPTQVNSFMSAAQATGRAFGVFFHGCMADASCNAAYPHLQSVFYQLVVDLNATPITFQATLQSGKTAVVHFTGDDLVLWLRESLYYSNLIPWLPGVIFDIRQHTYSPLSQLYGRLIDDTMSWGMFYSVMCGEDAAYTTQHALQTSVQGLAPQAQPALLASVKSWFSVCQFWKVKPVPTTQKEPVTSSIPTLIVQGEYDPVTPPTNGKPAAQTLSTSYFFQFPGMGHLVRTSSVCPNTIMRTFLENPTVKPDAACISSMSELFFI